ncbi:MAG: histidine kinase [Spirosomataceae bacterium]
MKTLPFRSASFLVLWLLCAFSVSSFAQNSCTCREADWPYFDRLNDNGDSTEVIRMINSLKKSNNPVCAVNAATMELTFVSRYPSKELTLGLIQDQEKLINRLDCKNELMVQAYLNYAHYYKKKEDYENLSLYAFKALESAEIQKNKIHELKAVKYIVYLFTRQNQDEKNWPYIKRAEKIILNLPEDDYTPLHYNWLAFEYENKYTLTQRKTLLDSALTFAAKAKASGLPLRNFEQLTASYRVYESVAYHRGNLKKAVVYMDSALFYAKKIKIPTNLASLYLAKAWDLVDLKSNKEAIASMDTSIFYTAKYNQGSIASIGIYSEAMQIFEQAGHIPKAYAALKTYEHLKDSLFKVKRAEKINELEQKYNKTKNENTIRELAQERRIYLLLALVGILAAAAIGFFLRQQTLKHKKDILETEQRLNRARMNPHFFFNALTALQKFALWENDGQTLAKNLSKFSNIMRETLESTYKEYVTIEKEMDFLSEYLEVQKLRFPQKFSYDITADEALEINEVLIPSMILQPFIENSIEHGFAGIDYPGQIKVHFSAHEKEVFIQIKDNGKGLNTQKKNDNEHISRAGQIIKDRIYLLNIKLKSKAGFSIDNDASGQGVIVNIHLPLLYTDDKTA